MQYLVFPHDRYMYESFASIFAAYHQPLLKCGVSAVDQMKRDGMLTGALDG